MRKLNFSAWLKITKDLWVLDTVKNGYQIEFNVFPQGSSFMNEIQFSKEKTEIDKLLMKGAIKEVDSVEDQLISNLFKVPQKDGSFRPVVNLKKMNLFVEYHHFKQENLSIGLDIIQKNDSNIHGSYKMLILVLVSIMSLRNVCVFLGKEQYMNFNFFVLV